MLKALKHKYYLSLGTCQKYVAQFTDQLQQFIGMQKELN